MPRRLPQAIATGIERLGAETPAFVYDLDYCHERLARLQTALPFASIYYAVKANPLLPILRFMASVGVGAEVASIGELRTAIMAGFRPERIVFGGPAKSPSDVDEAISLGIRAVHCESILELEYALSRRMNLSSTLIVGRVNPEVGLRTTIENMSGGPSRFGIDVEELISWKDNNRSLWSQVDGLHLYQASQVRMWSQIRMTVETLDDMASQLFDEAPRYLNYGGGFGIPLALEQPELDLDSLGRWWWQQPASSSSAERALELGRYIIGPTGHLLTTVIRTKSSRGHVYIMTDGGINVFIRPKLTGEQHHVEVLRTSPAECERRSDVIITGPLCTPIDEIATSDIHVNGGDLVVIHDAGAYGPTLSPQFFLGHPTPTEWVVEDGRLRQVRRRRIMTEYCKDGLVDDVDQ